MMMKVVLIFLVILLMDQASFIETKSCPIKMQMREEIIEAGKFFGYKADKLSYLLKKLPQKISDFRKLAYEFKKFKPKY